MNNTLVARLIGELKAQQSDIAQGAMVRPQSDLFEHGQMVGRYQGIQLALDALDSLLRGDEDEERKS